MSVLQYAIESCNAIQTFRHGPPSNPRHRACNPLHAAGIVSRVLKPAQVDSALNAIMDLDKARDVRSNVDTVILFALATLGEDAVRHPAPLSISN